MQVHEELRTAGSVLGTLIFSIVVTGLAIPPVVALFRWWWRLWVE